jgi:hypothetical protein
MKNLLILAYDFPPYVSVGGLRPYSWYKYLKDFDINPIVITRHWSNDHGNDLDYIAPSKIKEITIENTEFGTIIRAPFNPNYSNILLLKYGAHRFRIIRKIITAFYELTQFLFLTGSKACVYKAAQSYLNNHKVDAIIATGEPFVLFKYASMLSKKSKIPWIADYRDNWSMSADRSKNKFLLLWNKFFEKRILKSATEVTTVSEFVSYQIKKILPQNKISIIYNGYDSSIHPKNHIKNDYILNIAFAGSVTKYYKIDDFMVVLNDFIQQHPSQQIRLHLIGLSKKENLKCVISKYPIVEKNSVEISKLPNEKYIDYLSSMDALLLFNDYYAIGTKLFDYLLVKKKILFCFEDDLLKSNLKQFYDVDTTDLTTFENNHVQADIIRDTNSGIVVADKAQLYNVLVDFCNEIKEKGKIECHSVKTEQYSRKIQAKKLAEIVNEICIK